MKNKQIGSFVKDGKKLKRIEKKKSHIKMLKMELLDCAINKKCCSVDGGQGICPRFFPTLGDLTAQESPPWEFECPRVSLGGGGGGGGGVGVLLAAAGID